MRETCKCSADTAKALSLCAHLFILKEVGRIESVSQVQLQRPLCAVQEEAGLCRIKVAQPVQDRIGWCIWGDAQDVRVVLLLLPGRRRLLRRARLLALRPPYPEPATISLDLHSADAFRYRAGI